MTTRSVLGVDPGPTPGLALLTCEDGALTGVQLSMLEGDYVLRDLDQYASVACRRGLDVLAVERFVVSRRTARAKTKGASLQTIAQVEALVDLVTKASGTGLVRHPAGVVKPWATDERLLAYVSRSDFDAASVHTRDALRHALFVAVNRGWLPHR